MNLRLEGLRRRYGRITALDGADADFPAGSCTAVLGPNGGGKSTLLRLAALVEPPDAGSVRYQDRGLPVPHQLPLRRRIALVPPGDTLFSASVLHNVAYGLRLRGLPRAEAHRRVAPLLQRLDLEHLAPRHARTLSSGEAQRVAVARALAVEPEVLFLDEPTASADPESTARIEDALRDLRRRPEVTLVLVTHRVDQARRLADRVLFLRAGRVVEAGERDAVLDRPADPLTRAFLANGG